MPLSANELSWHSRPSGCAGRGYGESDFAALLRQQADSAGLALVSEHAEVSDGLGPGEDDPARG